MKITHKQLIEKLKGNGARIVGIAANIDARAKKTGNPFGAISKDIRAVGFCGADYGKAVQREGERQGADAAASFVAESLPWGEWLVANKVIAHKGEFYLRTQSTPGQRNRQPARVLAYRNEQGQFITKEQAAPFLPAVAESRKQSAVGIEGATEQVHVRTYKFANIRKLRIDGHTFELVPD